MVQPWNPWKQIFKSNNRMGTTGAKSRLKIQKIVGTWNQEGYRTRGIKIGEQVYEEVEKLKYLGVVVNEKGKRGE